VIDRALNGVDLPDYAGVLDTGPSKSPAQPSPQCRRSADVPAVRWERGHIAIGSLRGRKNHFSAARPAYRCLKSADS
jgi:hypothetical protein